MNFVKKIVPYCLYLLLIIFIVFGIHSIIYTQGRFVFWCEDLFETYVVCLKDHNFFDVLNLNHHHSMLYSLYCNLFRLYIPGIFAVHPLTFFDKITSFINSFIIFELLFVFSACFLNYFPKRKFWMNLIVCLLIFPAFAAVSSLSYMWFYYYNISWFAAYAFLPLFVFTMFNEFQSHFVINENFSKRRLIVLFILTLLTAATFEIFKYIKIAITIY